MLPRIEEGSSIVYPGIQCLQQMYPIPGKREVKVVEGTV